MHGGVYSTYTSSNKTHQNWSAICVGTSTPTGTAQNFDSNGTLTIKGSSTLSMVPDTSNSDSYYETLAVNCYQLTIGEGSDAPTLYYTAQPAYLHSYALQAYSGFTLNSGSVDINCIDFVDKDVKWYAVGVFVRSGDIVINGGTLKITVSDKAPSTPQTIETCKGLATLNGNSVITINGGAVDITVSGDANTQRGIDAAGNVTVSAGTLTVTNTKNNEAVYAGGTLTMGEFTTYNEGSFQSGQYIYSPGAGKTMTSVTIQSCTVTYKVVNGTWSDDTTADKTENVASGSKPASVPTGMKASEGYTGGAWDTNPADATITEAATFTYTFIPTYTVTYKVVNGTWSDGTTADKTETVASGSTPADVPTGMIASSGYTAGAWDTDPTAAAISAEATFTYTFTAKQQATVTTAPAAKENLIYNGQSQALVDSGVAEGGTLYYALGSDATTAPADNLYITSIPTVADAGTYYVWYMAKGDETHGDSAPQAVTVVISAPGQINVTVTFKVVNGAWGDGTRTDKTVVLTGNEGEELRLTLADIPRVTKPDEGYVFGSGTWTPSEPPIILEGEPMGDPITEDTTFTYTYAPENQISVTVTLKVVHGTWDDGTREVKTIVLTGYEGEELRLTLDDMPGVTKPDEGYKFSTGVWTPDEPPINFKGQGMGDPITEDTTFTFTYGARTPVSHIVTFKVVNGAWSDGTREDKTIILTGYEGDELRLTLDDMPGVTKPDEGYKFGTGVWTPEEPPIDFHGIPMGDPITEDITFTYTYGVMPNVKTKTETKDLNAVPAALDDKCQTLEALKKDMLLNLVVAGKAAQMENTVFYDVELMVSTDDGKTWVPAAEENFPVGGITAILPYPTGTSAQTHNFAAAHMFTLSSGLLGTVAGEIEYPAVTADADGLHVQLNGLSPVAIAYEPIRPQPTKDPSKFEDVAVPSGTFSFTKLWEGDSEKSIDFTLYKIDGSVYHHGFDKKVVSNREWRYNAWFSSPAACYVIEKPVPGYITRYVNVVSMPRSLTAAATAAPSSTKRYPRPATKPRSCSGPECCLSARLESPSP